MLNSFWYARVRLAGRDQPRAHVLVDGDDEIGADRALHVDAMIDRDQRREPARRRAHQV